MERSDGSVLVQTESGPVVGRRCTGVYGDEYVSFEGIPYARPPVGRLRFMAPLAVTPWTEPLDCRAKGPKPLQFNHYSKQLEGVEDSLQLNVYAKKLHSAKPLPLIVFFFGGGFEKGDPTTDLHGPDYFMMQDVVVVTISYRVGPLGFLLLNDPAVGVAGNAGLKDQLLGLQWIHANAASFNADPNNVTAFGESAGAASVHYLMLNPKAEGLFHKAILQSGNVLCTWAQCPINDMPQRLAGNLGMENVNDATDAMILDYLQALPGEQLVKPYLLTHAELMDDCVFQFGPMVEPYKTDHCVLPKQPSELLATAWGNKIPLLMSGTSFEGLLMYARVFVAPFLLTDLKDQPEHMLPLHLKRTLPLAVAQNLGKRLQATHFGESAALDLSPAGVLAYCEYATYKVFWLPIVRVARSRLRHSTAPTYLCRFDFDSPTFNHQRIKYVGDKLRGVAHVDDHSYLWFGSFAWKLDKHTTEFQTIERMIDIVTSFARSSNPNCPKVAEQLPRTKEWLPLDSRRSNVECLNISESIKLIELPELQKLRVWESVCKIED